MPRSLLSVTLCAALAGACLAPTPRGADGAAGSVDGWPAPAAEGGAATDPRRPAGDRAVPGRRDELGWILPLDVRRPQTPRPRPSAPARGGRSVPRRGLAAGGFPEHRLGPDDGHTQNETAIAAAAGTLVAGWNNYTDTTLVMGAGRSADGGDTWAWDLFGGHDAMSDPAVAAAGAGRWYFGYIARGGAGGSDFDVYVRRSQDDGLTWEPPVAVTTNAGFDDKPYLDAIGDEVLVGYADFSFSPAKVRAARSLDGGLSFGADTVLADNSVGGNGALPLIDGNGDYFVFWRDSFQQFLWLARSEDQGSTWSADAPVVAMNPLPPQLPGGFRIVNMPSAASPAPGHLVVVWNDQLLGDPDILAVRSTDSGATWSAPVRVNDDAGTAAQFFPWIAADEAGGLHVVWYDRRENGSDIDVYTAYSGDGGATFGANVRVTAAPFTPVLPWDVGIDFIGDYNGIAAADGRVYPFYQDARTGDQDVYVAVLPSPGVLFADGFESGDTGAWSQSVPPLTP